MNVMEIGQKLVAAVLAGREAEDAFVSEFYDADIVSIEGQSGEEMPQRMEGLEAVRGKHNWWNDNNDIHSTTATGPYCGHREDQFVIRHNMDITPTGGERMQMEEVGIYTLANGKIVMEEFLYLMG